MATASEPTTIADLLDGLGGIPARRVLRRPRPGTATVADVTRLHDRTGRHFELIDGSLVEKAPGFDESIVALHLAVAIGEYLKVRDLGAAVGSSAPMRLAPGRVVIPDAAFISWERFPARNRRRGAIPAVVPDLVVEVLSKSNTPKEMKRKLEEYFRAGVRLVWYVDPAKRTVRVYTAVDQSTLLSEGDTLDGGDVLPGLAIAIRDWFAEAERNGPRLPKRGG